MKYLTHYIYLSYFAVEENLEQSIISFIRLPDINLYSGGNKRLQLDKKLNVLRIDFIVV